jgi:GDP-L-fucose synthase
VLLMLRYNEPEIINVGTGRDITIRDLAALIAQITGFQGRIVYDASKPDGTPRKLLDVARLISLGWKTSISLAEGILQTYLWYCENRDTLDRSAQQPLPFAGSAQAAKA